MNFIKSKCNKWKECKNLKKTIISLGILILIVIGMICFFNKNESSNNSEKKQIITTIYPIYDFLNIIYCFIPIN